MGCWNETDCITQLPIESGEKIRVVFLVADESYGSPHASGFCYATDLWKPISLPIPGKYNDYGAIEGFDENDHRVVTLLKFLRENLVEREQGENPYHDVPVSKAEVTMEKVLEWVHESRLQIVNYSGIPITVGMCFIREDVYMGLVRQPIECWDKTRISVRGKMVEGYRWAEAESRKAAELKAAFEATTPGTPEHQAAHIKQILARMGREPEEFRSFGRVLRGLDSVGDTIKNALFEGADPTADAIRRPIRHMAEFHMVNIKLAQLRKFWSPQCGKGSQDDNFEAHVELARVVTEIAAKREAKRKAEYEAEG